MTTITKIGPKHQITIPKEVFKNLGLEIGDFLEVKTRENIITMTPRKLVLKDQAWFYTPEWQKKEKEADKAITKGDISGPFSSAKELVRHLNKKKSRS